jgi:hypothetical protein
MMLKRKVIIFVLVSVSSGIFAVIGSILGGSLFGQMGLFIGALVLGILSVVVNTLILYRVRWIGLPELYRSMTGGVIGFLLAAVLAVSGSRAFNSPVVPVLSVMLVGIGVLLGLRRGGKNETTRP